MKEYIANLHDKKIMISGANGYIGRELASQFLSQKIEYIGVDKKENKDFPHVKLNLENPTETIKLISSFNCDYFVHAATHSALAYNDNFIESFTQDMNVLRNIFLGLKSNPKCRLIYFSSSYVYSGISRKNEVDETISLSPTHNFGLAKSFFEQIILRNHPNSIILRLSSVFGGVNSIHPNAITNMAIEAMEDKLLTVWGKGDRQMQYIYIEDVVKYILRSFIIDSGVYNLGANDYNSVLDTARKIADFFNVEVKSLLDKKEGFTLPYMNNKKIITATNVDFSEDQSANLNKYLNQLTQTL